jgi:proline iminopeptidase
MEAPMSGYLDYSGRDDVLSGGVRKIPVTTPKGTFSVWVKRVGNAPGLGLLLLHGGPGATHEYFEACDSFLPAAGIEYYYYDQLGSFYSDQPDEPSLWETSRFVDEVEQVRRALGLDRDNFVLLGHSWGGILAIEYALAHQEHLRGLVISNMMSSVPAYNAYAEQVLMPPMDQEALAEIKAFEAAGDTENPRYEALLLEQHYVHHVLRLPPADWPDPAQRAFAHINRAIYVSMQGPSELGISADASLAHWERTAELASIQVPTLVIGAQHDTMDPAHMRMMADRLPFGSYLHCPDGSHMAMYDDQQVYFRGLVSFLRGLGLCDSATLRCGLLSGGRPGAHLAKRRSGAASPE